MDPGLVTAICIILAVTGVVFWLPVIVFFPVIKSLADRIAGKTTQNSQITQLQQKILLLEHELSDIKLRQTAIEDSQNFDHQLVQNPSRERKEPKHQ